MISLSVHILIKILLHTLLLSWSSLAEVSHQLLNDQIISDWSEMSRLFKKFLLGALSRWEAGHHEDHQGEIDPSDMDRIVDCLQSESYTHILQERS